jgi:hypothetical protein
MHGETKFATASCLFIIVFPLPINNTYLLTYSMEQSPFWEANRFTASQVIVKPRRFITAFTSELHLSVCWTSSIQSILRHPTSWRSILILSSYLSLGLTSGLFPSGFPTKTLSTPLLSPLGATCPAHLILLDFITRKILGEKRISNKKYGWQNIK